MTRRMAGHMLMLVVIIGGSFTIMLMVSFMAWIATMVLGGG